MTKTEKALSEAEDFLRRIVRLSAEHKPECPCKGCAVVREARDWLLLRGKDV